MYLHKDYCSFLFLFLVNLNCFTKDGGRAIKGEFNEKKYNERNKCDKTNIHLRFKNLYGRLS